MLRWIRLRSVTSEEEGACSIEQSSNVLMFRGVCALFPVGDSTCGQKALYEVGITGIPVYNVNNSPLRRIHAPHCARSSRLPLLTHSLILSFLVASSVDCSTGSSALFMAKQFIQGGLNECVLAVGFEKMVVVTATPATHIAWPAFCPHLHLLSISKGPSSKTAHACACLHRPPCCSPTKDAKFVLLLLWWSRS
jgi:hypothetical protein